MDEKMQAAGFERISNGGGMHIWRRIEKDGSWLVLADAEESCDEPTDEASVSLYRWIEPESEDCRFEDICEGTLDQCLART